ncbi:molybdate ABC transporter substrate-binding protein [Nitrospira sp. Kam-Ns4a]
MQRTGNRHAALVVFSFFAVWGLAPHVWAAETLVIAASPSLKAPIEALARAFEVRRPDVRVNVWYDTGLDLRRTVAAMENDPTGKYFIGRGPIHLIAPGGDELLTRLEHKYYVLPGTRQAYAAVPLVLAVPEQLVEAPTSFEELGRGATYRIAIADPALTELGRQTWQLLEALGLAEDVKGRLDVATDSHGVLDHLLYGQADVGILFGPDAVRERERIRIVAVAGPPALEPTVHSMAMERYCPNRALCREFLAFVQSPEAQAIVRSLGYASPAGR